MYQPHLTQTPICDQQDPAKTVCSKCKMKQQHSLNLQNQFSQKLPQPLQGRLEKMSPINAPIPHATLESHPLISAALIVAEGSAVHTKA
jgi:hypothetical protein